MRQLAPAARRSERVDVAAQGVSAFGGTPIHRGPPPPLREGTIRMAPSLALPSRHFINANVVSAGSAPKPPQFLIMEQTDEAACAGVGAAYYPTMACTLPP